MRVASAPAARRLAALATLALVPFAAAGCHDEERLRKRLEGPAPVRLPVEPDQPSTPPAPALLDTVRPWQPPSGVDTSGWEGLAEEPVDDDSVLRFRVPTSWEVDEERGRATNGDGSLVATVSLTQLDESSISLATYAAQLAEGNPLYQYSSVDGHIVYVTRREVSVAPSDPGAPRNVFHTAATSVDGRIAKLDVRYDRALDWRFDELAAAIVGTLEVRRVADDA